MKYEKYVSFTFATAVPLNISCGWLGVDFVQENKTSVACLVGSGLNSNFHWWAHWWIMLRSWFKLFPDIAGTFTIEKACLLLRGICNHPQGFVIYILMAISKKREYIYMLYLA